MDYRLLVTVAVALGGPVLLLIVVTAGGLAMARRADRRRAREWTELSLVHINRAKKDARP